MEGYLSYKCVIMAINNSNIPIKQKEHFLNYLKKIVESDVVEVVRCKECGSYNKNYGECTLNGSHFGENGYCCKGTQKLRCANMDVTDTNVGSK